MALRTVEQQLQALLGACQPLDPIELPLLEATGCVLAEAVHARWPVPAFPVVTVDGYAVRSADLAAASRPRPIRLAVIDRVAAGFRAEAPVREGEAVHVVPGAMLPEGADAVVPLAVTDGGSHTVLVGESARAGSGVRPSGAFAGQGQAAVRPGVVLGATQQGALVAAGRSRVRVHPAPRVVVITIGTELVAPGTSAEPGLVHDANAVALTVAIREVGGVPYRAGPVPDDSGVLASVVEGQRVRADLIVIAGGMSRTVPGTFDGGSHPRLAPAAVSPGPVVAFGMLDSRIPVLALPGEPVSAMINYEVFVRPLIRRLAGRRELFRPVVHARLAAPVDAPPGVRRFVPVALRDGKSDAVAEPVPAGQELSPFAAVSVTGLAVVPEDVTAIGAGGEAVVIRLDRT